MSGDLGKRKSRGAAPGSDWRNILCLHKPYHTGRESGRVVFTHAHLAERVVAEAMRGDYAHNRSMGWMRWDGTVWKSIDRDMAGEVVRQWAKRNYDEAAGLLSGPGTATSASAPRSYSEHGEASATRGRFGISPGWLGRW